MKKLNFLQSLNTEEFLKADKTFWNHLSENAYPVTKGKFRLPISIEPFILKKSDFKKIENDLANILSASKKIASQYFANNKIQNILKISEQEQEILKASKNENFTGIVRADIFFDKTPQLVEINTDYPDGFIMHDKSVSGIHKQIQNKNFKKTSHINELIKLIKQHNINENNHILIAHDKGRTFVDEFYLTQLELTKHGFTNVSVGKIEDCEFKHKKIYFKNKEVNLIRRCFEISKIRNDKKIINGIISAIENRNIAIINNFKMRLLGHKSMLKILMDDKFKKYFTKQERKSISNLIPKTIELNNKTKQEAILEKNKWVLKASDLTEGDGVFIDEDLSQTKWENIISSKLNLPNWILQEKVSIPETAFNLADNNTRTKIKRKYDFNPHIIMGKKKISTGHILTRFSSENILNVTKGGGLTYTLIEDS